MLNYNSSVSAYSRLKAMRFGMLPQQSLQITVRLVFEGLALALWQFRHTLRLQ